MIDWWYALLERWGGHISTWAWRKRWSNREIGTGYQK